MTETAINSPYLTALEAAVFLRLEERTLNNMRWRGEGPHWRKHGGKVIYHRRDLEGWSRENDFGDGPSYDVGNSIKRQNLANDSGNASDQTGSSHDNET